MRITIPGKPITKKNSSRIIYRKGRSYIVPSKQYIQYEKDCAWYIKDEHKLNINTPINLKVVYYMPTRHIVDLCNLLAATCDILVKYGVIEDDNSKIVVSHDGSRVYYDKENPKCEIEISEVE